MKTFNTFLIALLLLISAFIFPALSTISAGSDTPVAFNIAWSPDGRWMAVSSNQGAWFFDLEDPSAEPLHLLGDRMVSNIVFDPTADSRAAIASENPDYTNGDWAVHMLELETPDTLDTIYAEGDSFPVLYELGFTHEGRYLYNTDGQVLHLYDLETEETRLIAADRSDGSPEHWITSVAETNVAGQLITSHQNMLSLFDLNQPAREEQIASFAIDLPYIYEIEFVANTTYLLHSYTGIYTFDTTTEALTALDQPISDHVSGFELDHDEQLLAIGGEQRWALYDVAAESVLLDMPDLDIQSDWNPVVFTFAFNPDATQIATLAVDGHITIYDLATGEVITTVGDFASAISVKWG